MTGSSLSFSIHPRSNWNQRRARDVNGHAALPRAMSSRWIPPVFPSPSDAVAGHAMHTAPRSRCRPRHSSGQLTLRDTDSGTFALKRCAPLVSFHVYAFVRAARGARSHKALCSPRALLARPHLRFGQTAMAEAHFLPCALYGRGSTGHRLEDQRNMAEKKSCRLHCNMCMSS